ncbi:proto-oncogene serine/threonine-protein kinase mos [Ceratitis capitata]|uniref:proto-oncogene serine/threonine-protein kinase mos n=1 Tax=Ceratitis capitata TaxID=7213 RepID=UPI0003299503|nr:proto-oncogene serine/threonine-protein kinase mos [Ceratitis capitata]
MALLQLPLNNEHAIELNTPNRNEILKDGLPKHTKYKILGKGAFGTVFKAIFRGQPVAVKIVRNVGKANVQSMTSETQILGWNHRNIIRILKVETTPNFGIVIMERFVSQNLQEIIDAKKLPLEHRIFISLDILSALSHCHKRNLLHLDVKPQNVLIAFAGIQPKLQNENLTTLYHRRQYVCKLCDFGASMKIDAPETTSKGNARGTIRYMAPEALREEPLTAATDIYSLGIIMWQMRQRRLPYHWIACNEVVAYQVVKNKLRPDSAAAARNLKNTPHGCTSALHATMQRHHTCHCTNSTAEEITYHSLIHLTNVLNRAKQPEEQLRFSDCAVEESKPLSERRPFASLSAKMNVTRNLSAELSSSKSPAAPRSPLTPKNAITFQQQTQQKRSKCDVADVLVLFEDILRLHDRDKENKYEALFRACWSDGPLSRPCTAKLRKSLTELL